MSREPKLTRDQARSLNPLLSYNQDKSFDNIELCQKMAEHSTTPAVVKKLLVQVMESAIKYEQTDAAALDDNTIH